MQLLQNPQRAPRARRGAALMLSMLVLMVLVLIVWQIGIGTRTQFQVARNDVTGTHMDLAIESALLEVFEQLKADAEADSQGGGGMGGLQGGASADTLAGALGGAAGGEEEGGSAAPADSRRDDWARPQRTSINDIQLRILIQDESSKYNVLSMLSEDEEEAEKAFQRVVRILDLFREGTAEDLASYEAQELAETLREHLTRRADSALPQPALVTDDEELPDRGLPLTIEELVALEPYRRGLFQDFRDEEGNIVHSLASYLTISSSMQTRAEMEEEDSGVPGGGGAGGTEQEGDGEDASTITANQDGTITTGTGQQGPDFAAGGQEAGAFGMGGDGGENGPYALPGAVNLNTAPPVVLKALFDDRDVRPTFWDDVIEYRNEEDEEATDPDADPVLDEFGEEIVLRKYFSSVDQLPELDAWAELEPLAQAEVAQLVGTRSNVFSIYVTARRSTGAQGDAGALVSRTREEQEEAEQAGDHLARTVRCLVWRRSTEEGVQIVPLERWEVLDYTPFEILDFPDDER